MPRRRIALLLLLAGALALGGWALVGPALATRTPAAAESPIDIETPASRAQLDAAIALARTPDPPFFVFALDPPAAAASAAVDGKGRCGEDDVAVFREPTPDPADGAIHLELPVPDADGVVRHQPGELRPAGVGYTGAMRRIDAALRASSDPFDRALADSLDLGQITPPPARLDALVQDALAVSDARTYGLAYAACNSSGRLGDDAAAPPSCARLSATEWARRDPGNGQPWIWALDHADKTGDVAGQQEALRGLLAASRFDVRFHAGAAAVARLEVPDADLTAQSMASMQALAFTPGPHAALTQRCRNGAASDAELPTTCSRIALAMYEHSDSFLSRNIGGSLHRIVTGDSGWLDRAHQEQGRLGRLVADSTAVGEGSPCGEARALLKQMVRLDAVGEIPLAQEAARAASPPPAHATP